MPSEYPRLDVSRWQITWDEPDGDSSKVWLRDTSIGSSPAWLFKETTRKTVPVKQSEGGGSRDYRQAEDYSEKLCAELAAGITLPACAVELAERNGAPGSISLNIRPSGWSLHGGGVFLSEIDETYTPKMPNAPAHNRVGHTLTNIKAVLADKGAPPEAAVQSMTAMEYFFGYLLFDAWVANRDRHEMNWALLGSADGEVCLSPSFDHGAAMGSGLEDPLRERLLDRDEVGDWCRRGTAHRFQDSAGTSLLDFARGAAALVSVEAVEYWVDRLTGVESGSWDEILDRLPLSPVSRRFCSEVLRINQGRIRDEFERS